MESEAPRITIVYDNRVDNPELQPGWGFSCHIDFGDRKILFDTGADWPAFLSNFHKLNLSLEAITDVLFSHKHDDHTAGIDQLLPMLKPETRIFVPKGFSIKDPRANHLNDLTPLGPNAYSLVMSGGIFLSEQALVLDTPRGLAIITGCAHPGVDHIAARAKELLSRPIELVLGGFHLFRNNQKEIAEIVGQFQALDVARACPCHCTGDPAIEAFRLAYQDRFHKIGTGTVITLERSP